MPQRRQSACLALEGKILSHKTNKIPTKAAATSSTRSGSDPEQDRAEGCGMREVTVFDNKQEKIGDEFETNQGGGVGWGK